MPHLEIFAAMAPGADLMVDDGKVRLRIQTCSKEHSTAEVLADNRMSDRKGVTLKGAVLAMTAKDRDDLAFALRLGVDATAKPTAASPSRRTVPA